jgi:predicted HAD superfamily Cof-like phosphohydrolase
MLAEELFEFCGYSRDEAKRLAKEFADIHSSKEAVNISGKTVIPGENRRLISSSDLVDAVGDMIFIANGSIYKLGYDGDDVLRRICDHNDKKGARKDSDGKIIKDGNFVEPEHTKEEK